MWIWEFTISPDHEYNLGEDDEGDEGCPGLLYDKLQPISE